MPKDESFHCPICNLPFQRKYNVTQHVKNVHHKNIPKVDCPFWPKCKDVHKANGQYSNNANLKVHLKKHHKDEENIDEYLRDTSKSKRSEQSKSKKLSQSEEIGEISSSGIFHISNMCLIL